MGLRNINVWRTVDWVLILLYFALVFAGWITIYAAGYDFDDASIFDLAERSGTQLMWIGISVVAACIIMLIDDKDFETYAYPIYALIIVLLVLTIFLAPNIKGSHSWLVIGPIRLQPAEFAKFATALALARTFSQYGFSLKHTGDLMKASGIILLPVLLILLQDETGSALVFLSLALVLYREGLSGMVLFAAFFAVLYFVLDVKYETTFFFGSSLGESLVLVIILSVLLLMIRFYARERRMVRYPLYFIAGVTSVYVVLWYVGIEIPVSYVVLGVIALTVVYLLVFYIRTRIAKILLAVGIALASVAFLYSVDYVFNDILQPHQQLRIKVALGIDDDIRGAGYNVNQAKIAIGSGGMFGKGFLNGTQTKLKYVPEQDTDFIFCTIGEEEGFVGSVLTLTLFAALLCRIIVVAERQRKIFGRVYAYCVASIIFFHVAVNVGMVIGLCPVIGIPLPFFSYGGSSLLGFTVLLFILLRIDASHTEHY